MSDSSKKKWLIAGGTLVGLGVAAGLLYAALREPVPPRRLIWRKKDSSEKCASDEEESSSWNNIQFTYDEEKSSQESDTSDVESEEETEFCSSGSEYVSGVESVNDMMDLSSGSEYHSIGESFSSDDESNKQKRRKKRILRKRKGSVITQNDYLFKKVDRFMQGDDDERNSAFAFLENLRNELSEHPDFLWRYARAHQIQAIVAGASTNLNAKRSIILEGLKQAQKAVEIDENNGDAHKWYAILIGMKSELGSTPVADKISGVILFHEHLLRAMKLKPLDHCLYYLYGRFKFELSCLNWFQRKAMETTFGPLFSYENAIKDCLIAEELSPNPMKANKLLLAKCYMQTKEYGKAHKFLECAKNIPSRNIEDRTFDKEIEELTKKIAELP